MKNQETIIEDTLKRKYIDIIETYAIEEKRENTDINNTIYKEFKVKPVRDVMVELMRLLSVIEKGSEDYDHKKKKLDSIIRGLKSIDTELSSK